MKCKHLVLSSGGLKAYAFLGPCKKLDLTELESVSGSSAGSIVGLTICLTKGDMNKTIEYASNDENIFIKKDDINIRHFMINYGVNDGSRIVQVCENALEEFTGKRKMTFKELFDYCGIHYYVTVSNMTKKRKVVYCYKETPDMDVATAVRMSTAVPFYFTSVVYNGDHYVDGALFSPEPFEPILKYHEAKPDNAVLIRTKNNEIHEIKSVLDYIISFVDMIVHIITVPTHLDLNEKFTCIDVETTDIPFISHNFTKEIVEDCVSKGEACWNGS
jgi:predicted acylesterase/phospholipase RssA